mgnify:CR=1 FL=1
MADVAASVLARLKNKAAKSGRSYQLCLQLFCQEEFLRRLEKSKYAENLVLKGGLFLYSLTDFDSRVTADVDFLLRKMPNTAEQLQAILEEIIATQTGNDFITFEKCGSHYCGKEVRRYWCFPCGKDKEHKNALWH